MLGRQGKKKTWAPIKKKGERLGWAGGGKRKEKRSWAGPEREREGKWEWVGLKGDRVRERFLFF